MKKPKPYKKNLFFRASLFALICFQLSACHTATFTSSQSLEKLKTEPQKEIHHAFWFWGLKGEYDVELRQQCKGKLPEQYSSGFSRKNIASGLLTLGIYSPKTVSIWCYAPNPEKQEQTQ